MSRLSKIIIALMIGLTPFAASGCTVTCTVHGAPGGCG